MQRRIAVTCHVCLCDSGRVRAQEEQKGWNASQSWEAGTAKEVFPGTETSKTRPWDAQELGRGRGKS